MMEGMSQLMLCFQLPLIKRRISEDMARKVGTREELGCTAHHNYNITALRCCHLISCLVSESTIAHGDFFDFRSERSKLSSYFTPFCNYLKCTELTSSKNNLVKVGKRQVSTNIIRGFLCAIFSRTKSAFLNQWQASKLKPTLCFTLTAILQWL